jgi:K+-transporting ATPase KdpF subunit
MSSVSATIIFSHMSGADLFGLVVSVIVCAYLLYALLRGEKF